MSITKTQFSFGFWSITAVLLILFFSREYGNMLYAFYFVTLLLPVMIGTSYLVNEFLIPKYLLTQRYAKFSLYSIYTLIVSSYLEMVIIVLAYIYLANYQFDAMIPMATDLAVLIITSYLFVLFRAVILLYNRALDSQKRIAELMKQDFAGKAEFLLVRADRTNTKIPLSIIEYIESMGDYVKIVTSAQGVVITKEKISKLAEKLPNTFLRIHRSFIVNSDKINSFTKETISTSECDLPISRTYKQEVIASLTKS
jgi:two-component system response regulator LytT